MIKKLLAVLLVLLTYLPVSSTDYNVPFVHRRSTGPGSLSVLFDGTSQYMTHLATPITAFPFTMCGWLYIPSSVVANQKTAVALSSQNSSSYQAFLEWRTSSAGDNTLGRISAGSKATGNSQRSAASAEPAYDTWIQVCGVWEVTASTNDRTVFINGTAQTSSSTTVDLFAGAPTLPINQLSIGAKPKAGVNQWETYWIGRLAHIAVWNVDLRTTDANAIKKLAGTNAGDDAIGSNPLAIQADHLVAYYPFYNGTDLSGLGEDMSTDATDYDLSLVNISTGSALSLPPVDAAP